MYRIVIADDHGLYRRGLRMALASNFPGSEIYEAQCFDEAINLLEEKASIDLIILDIHMPGLNTLDVLTDVLHIYPNTRFMTISGSEARSAILATLSVGLHGFIAKSQPDNEVIQAVSHVLSGRIYVPSLLSHSSMHPAQHFAASDAPNGQTPGGGNLKTLTPRQFDVLKLMAEGYSNKEIARDLDIAEATTKIHAAAVMRALGVRNRTEAAVLLKTWLTKNPV